MENTVNTISKGEKLVRILSVIFGIFFLIILFIYKISNPNLKWGTGIIIAIFIIIFFSIIIFFTHYYIKNKSLSTDKLDSKLPKPITLEQARELALSQLKHPFYADYSDGAGKETNELLGKNIKSYVYSFTTKGIYSNDNYTIIFNRHFPDSTMNILINAFPNEVARVKNTAAFSPSDEPEVETIERENPLLGTHEKITKTIQKTDKEKEKKEEDL